MNIVLWTLRNTDGGPVATESQMQRLRELVQSRKGQGRFDIIWGPELTVQSINVGEDSMDYMVVSDKFVDGVRTITIEEMVDDEAAQ